MTTETDNGAPEGVTEDLAAPETVLEAQEDAQPGDDAAAPTEGEGEQPKRKTVQDRIDELTADKHHLRRENEDLRAEVERWRQQQASPPQAPKDGDGRPNPEDFQDGVYDPSYLEALTDWKAERAVAKRFEDREQQTAQERALTDFNTRAAQAFPNGEPDGLKAIRAMPRLSTHIGEAILAMEDGPKVADFLGSNQGELARIQALGPTAQILALAKISAGLTPAAAPIANRTPGAPPPPDSRVRGATGQYKVAADTNDFLAFDKAYGGS